MWVQSDIRAMYFAVSNAAKKGTRNGVNTRLVSRKTEAGGIENKRLYAIWNMDGQTLTVKLIEVQARIVHLRCPRVRCAGKGYRVPTRFQPIAERQDMPCNPANSELRAHFEHV